MNVLEYGDRLDEEDNEVEDIAKDEVGDKERPEGIGYKDEDELLEEEQLEEEEMGWAEGEEEESDWIGEDVGWDRDFFFAYSGEIGASSIRVELKQEEEDEETVFINRTRWGHCVSASSWQRHTNTFTHEQDRRDGRMHHFPVCVSVR